jgi:hypothetical protein
LMDATLNVFDFDLFCVLNQVSDRALALAFYSNVVLKVHQV